VVQNIDAIRSMLEPDEVTLLFLPLAHALTKIIALVGMEWGVKLACATDADHLLEEMATVRPTMLVAVPRVFEKVFNKAKHTADEDGHGSIFDKAAAVAGRSMRFSTGSSTASCRPSSVVTCGSPSAAGDRWANA
jgi:long-chain acyl-CoA synthetase